MSKLPTVTGKQAIRVFEMVGFSVVRVHGSHHLMKKDAIPHLLSVPVHGNSNLKPGTLRGTIRAAGMTVEEFVKLLQE